MSEWTAKRVPGPEQRFDLHHDAAVDTFDWPCDKRNAHGSHLVLGEGLTYDPKFDYICPGVLAHPAVMIGRQLR